MLLKDKIPLLYHSLCPDLISLDFPEEVIADCPNCALCRSPQSPYRNTKCCSYQPHLSNFLCGAVINDRDQGQGRERILEKISNRRGVTPYGIIPLRSFLVRKQELESNDFWSRPQELLEKQLCPFYYTGNCTIWKYRDHLCATYFCTSVGGAAGKKFWAAVNKYLKMTQAVLERYSMIRAGWTVHSLKPEPVTSKDFALEDEDDNVTDENYNRVWGDWAGREEEFYIKCYNIIKDIDRVTFRQLAGVTGEILESSVSEAHRVFIENILPDYLIMTPGVTTQEAGNGRLLLKTDNASYEIPSLLLPLIRGFNGERSTKAVFDLGYNVLYNMDQPVDELIARGILINAKNSKK